MEKFKTSTAEEINPRIKKALNYMRFITGNALVNYLIVRFALLNLAAKHSEITREADTEDWDLADKFNNLNERNCVFCQYVNAVEKEKIEA